jgi:hypothetical protein
MSGLDQVYDLTARLRQSEESLAQLHYKNRAVMDAMSQVLQVNQDMSRIMLSLVAADGPAHRDGMSSFRLRKATSSLMHQQWLRFMVIFKGKQIDSAP